MTVLRDDHNYLTIWGYWNGVDEMLARRDEAYCKGLDLGRALERRASSRIRERERAAGARGGTPGRGRLREPRTETHPLPPVPPARRDAGLQDDGR